MIPPVLYPLHPIPYPLPRGLPKRHATFLLNLAIAPSLDRADYQALTGVSHTTAKRDLAELLAAGLIARLGQGRAIRYALKIDA